MAQSPKGWLVHGLYKPRHGDCAICFYPGVSFDFQIVLSGVNDVTFVNVMWYLPYQPVIAGFLNHQQ